MLDGGAVAGRPVFNEHAWVEDAHSQTLVETYLVETGVEMEEDPAGVERGQVGESAFDQATANTLTLQLLEHGKFVQLHLLPDRSPGLDVVWEGAEIFLKHDGEAADGLWVEGAGRVVVGHVVKTEICRGYREKGA